MNNKHKIILFDAANTLIHKPSIWNIMLSVLQSYEYRIEEMDLRRKHKLISEVVHFPDCTSAEFYNYFNSELLFSLGIMPDEELLNDLFKACTYLPWEAFEDTNVLNQLEIKKAVLSNFNQSLKQKIETIFGRNIFETIIGSEEDGFRKPDIEFYIRAVKMLEVDPSEILYLGDSLKLDIVPAQSLGIDAWLIDRDNNFEYSKKRIRTFRELSTIM